MSTHKYIDRICVLAVVIALLISVLFMNGEALGIQVRAMTIGYEDRLFDQSKVHTIDIVIDDWDAFLQTAQSEEYSACSVVIDGEVFKNVGIRGKGNTSLSTVASMNSQRYSFKIEFDQYDNTQSYHGLDKLSLNNMIQDNTMMKDYLTYTMMTEFGAAAPLCSFVYITVNGEDWGLYLAVEAVEESFLRRNYGNDYGDLYKPDSISMGGGRGNGMDFDFEAFMGDRESTDTTMPTMPEGMDPGQMGSSGGGTDLPAGNTDPTEQGMGDFSQMGQMPGGFAQQEGMNGSAGGETPTTPENFDPSEMFGNMGGGMDFGMGSSDVKLQYIDDDPASYSTIFSSAKTDATEADQTRLIAALKELSEGSADAVDAEAVIRYFVVHNFVVNGDSYTGSMIHNYYLYEEDGRLSMIPWDYNLAFGTFHDMNIDAVNDDIDEPLSTGGGDRPMIDWIFSSEEYTALYHRYFREFLDTVDIHGIIEDAYALIAPYVEKDPTKFCTDAEFEAGVETLKAFCDLRSQSIRNQLDGNDTPVSTEGLEISAMGTMNVGGQQMPQGGDFPGADQGSQGGETPQGGSQFGENMQPPQQDTQTPAGNQPQQGESSSAGGEPSGSSQGGETGQFPGGSQPQQTPDGTQGSWPQIPGQDQMTLPTETADTTEPTAGEGNPFGDMQFPGEAGSIPGGNQMQFPDMGQEVPTATQNNSQWILLAVSAAVLLLGLLFAAWFKR